jgi:hypothetical protein
MEVEGQIERCAEGWRLTPQAARRHGRALAALYSWFLK